MIFSTDRILLAEAVSNLSRVVSLKTAVPVLEGILITAKDGKIELSSYNLETGMNKTLDADIKEEGSIVLSAKYFNSILHSMNGNMVEFTADDRLMCHLSSGTAVFDMMGMAAVDYPELPSVAEGTVVSVDAGFLKEMVRQTIFAIAPAEGTRPVLTGVFFEIEEGYLKLVAIDGFRMAIRKEKINVAEDIKFIASGRAVADVVKMMADDEEKVEIIIGRRHVQFSFAGYSFISRLIDGEYIDYKKTIPEDFTQKITFNTKELVSLIDRISLIISDTFTTPIRFIINEEDIVFSCATSVGRATERAKITLEGKPFEIGLNSKYLLEALRAIDYEKVVFNFKGGNAAVVLTPEDDDSFTYMIMPMRLR